MKARVKLTEDARARHHSNTFVRRRGRLFPESPEGSGESPQLRFRKRAPPVLLELVHVRAPSQLPQLAPEGPAQVRLRLSRGEDDFARAPPVVWVAHDLQAGL